MPVLTLIAGPNGSGKSTFTRGVDLEGQDRLLDTDAIARRLNPSNPSAAAMEAGREPKNLEAAPAKLQARLGQFDDGQVGSRTGEIDRIGADPAADLQNLLASPTVELSESWDMRLDEILPGLDLVEIIP